MDGKKYTYWKGDGLNLSPEEINILQRILVKQPAMFDNEHLSLVKKISVDLKTPDQVLHVALLGNRALLFVTNLNIEWGLRDKIQWTPSTKLLSSFPSSITVIRVEVLGSGDENEGKKNSHDEMEQDDKDSTKKITKDGIGSIIIDNKTKRKISQLVFGADNSDNSCGDDDE